jgi:hypothetical protein
MLTTWQQAITQQRMGRINESIDQGKKHKEEPMEVAQLNIAIILLSTAIQ